MCRVGELIRERGETARERERERERRTQEIEHVVIESRADSKREHRDARDGFRAEGLAVQADFNDADDRIQVGLDVSFELLQEKTINESAMNGSARGR